MEINQDFSVLAFLFSFLLLSSCSLQAFATSDHNGEVEDETPFTYIEDTGKGPKNWGNVNPQWKACQNGKLQSPIDLLDQRVQVLPSLGKLQRDYQPAPAVLKNRGHDIAVEWQGDAGKIVINDTDYKLQNCHWHAPSEHTVNGTRFAQELHIVHRSSSGGYAVVAILYKIGRPDTFLTKLLHLIKTTKAGEVKDLKTFNPGNIKFGNRKYYRYIGSLTVPPCTEGVIWTILKKVRTASSEQIHALRDAVHDGFEANARPIQDQTGRPVYFYRPKND